MKKRWAKIFGGLFAVALLVCGCATVSDVKNTSNEMIYYGGSAVSVGGYTYFANAYTPYSRPTDFDYGKNSKISYLARINQAAYMPNGKDFSPEKVEKVNPNGKEKVTGFQNQDMFVLGNYIYFTSINQYPYGKPLRHDYSLVTLYRSKLNGDDLKEVYTTEYFTGGRFAPVGDSQNGYYWVCFTGKYTQDNEFSGQIFSIKLGNKFSGQKKPIEDHVTSCAFADVLDDGNVDKIFYSKSETIGQNTQQKIYSIDYNGSGKEPYESNNDLEFVDKIEDRVFFRTSETLNSGLTFYRQIENIQKNDIFENTKQEFARSNEINQIWHVCKDDLFEGYVYAESNAIIYTVDGSAPTTLVQTDEDLDVLFVETENEQNYVYYSSGSSIFKISIKPEQIGKAPTPRELVHMDTLEGGQYGFDGKYVYFFAGLADVETQEGESDSNKYMYRIEKSGGEYQLISKTEKTRTPKEEE